MISGPITYHTTVHESDSKLLSANIFWLLAVYSGQQNGPFCLHTYTHTHTHTQWESRTDRQTDKHTITHTQRYQHSVYNQTSMFVVSSKYCKPASHTQSSLGTNGRDYNDSMHSGDRHTEPRRSLHWTIVLLAAFISNILRALYSGASELASGRWATHSLHWSFRSELLT